MKYCITNNALLFVFDFLTKPQAIQTLYPRFMVRGININKNRLYYKTKLI